MTVMQDERDLNWPPLLYLFLLSALPIFGMQFGEGNQIEQFSIVERLRDPGFAPGDFFLDSAAAPGQPRYYYSVMLAMLAALAPLTIVIPVLMVLSGVLLGGATYVACRRFLGADETGAALAATLALLNLGMSIGNAGYLVFSNFQPASIAISMGIAGITLLALGRIWTATALFLFAAVMHPTLGAEVSVIGYTSVLAGNALHGAHGRQLRIAISGLVFLAGLALFWAVPNMGGDGVKLTDPEFFAILAEFRAPHHYLGLDFLKRRWFEAILFGASILWILNMAWRSGANRRCLSILAAMIACVAALCLLSVYFVDIAESRIWVTAQLFRMVLLLKWAGYLLIGWLAGRWIGTGTAWAYVLVALMVLPSADALSYALAAVLATYLAISKLKLTGWQAVLAALPAIYVAADHQRHYGADAQTLRLAIACIALAALQIRPRLAGALAATVVVVGFLIAGLAMSGRGPFSRPDLQTALTLAGHDDDGTKISLLARDIGARDAMWLVPPSLEQFRFAAGRAIIADFTSIPFEDEGLREWRMRMEKMYGKTGKGGFAALREMKHRHRTNPATEVARQDYGAEYAVLFSDTPWNGEVLATAGAYKIVRLAP